MSRRGRERKGIVVGKGGGDKRMIGWLRGGGKERRGLTRIIIEDLGYRCLCSGGWVLRGWEYGIRVAG